LGKFMKEKEKKKQENDNSPSTPKGRDKKLKEL
jgi:hypothetical protein